MINRVQPKKKTIAEAIGVHPKTAQKHIAEMEKGGLIRCQEQRISGVGSKPNIYHFDGLIKEASEFAKEELEERKAREIAEKNKAGKKGRLNFKIIRGTDSE